MTLLQSITANSALSQTLSQPLSQTFTLALLFKISVPPMLVALMSLAARRYGPTFGGLIMGLPWMTGPVLFFLALDKGSVFAVRACTGVELAILGISAFLLVFGFATRWLPWWGCLAAAITAYVAVAAVTQSVDVSLTTAALGGAGALIMTYLGLPKPKTALAPRTPPRWDIVARMAATFVLVAGIITGADLLGPQRSGILASFPVIVTVIGSFTQAQSGSDAVLRVFRGVSLSLLTFAAFFLVLGHSLPVLGLVPSFLAAAGTALTLSAALISWNRRSTARTARVADRRMPVA
jgi:hypothetical protein